MEELRIIINSIKIINYVYGNQPLHSHVKHKNEDENKSQHLFKQDIKYQRILQNSLFICYDRIKRNSKTLYPNVSGDGCFN